nr:MAG TPA: hypothetical protein [Caudoviricetes sp.]
MPLPTRHQNRFCVVKWDDIYNNLEEDEVEDLCNLILKARRFSVNRRYVVISDKHPQEFEEAWGMKLAYIQRDIREREEVADQEVMAHLVREQPLEVRSSPTPTPWRVEGNTIRVSPNDLDAIADNQAFTDLLYQ